MSPIREYAEKLYRGAGAFADLGRDILELIDEAEAADELLDAVGVAIEDCHNEDLNPDDPVAAIAALDGEIKAIRQMAAAYGVPIASLPGAIEMLAMGCGFEKVKRRK